MRKGKTTYPTTPDARYFVVKGKLWRSTNPSLPEGVKTELVAQLMSARRAVKSALASGNQEELKAARSEVNQAKVELGERGPVWWTDGAADYNRHSVTHSPYAEWFETLE